MNKKELLSIPKRKWYETLSGVSGVYVIPSRRKHDSGWACMDFVAEFSNDRPMVRFGGGCDVVNFVGEDDLSAINLFYFRGRLDYLGLNFLEKRLMGGLFKAIEKKYPEDRTEVEAELLEAYYDDVDWSKKEYIDPLVEHVKSFMTAEQLADLEPRAAARIAEREKLEAEEQAAWDAEMARREALHQENLQKDEEYKLKRMSKKSRQRYLERKAAEAALAESEEDLKILAGEDVPEDAPADEGIPAEDLPEETGDFPEEESTDVPEEEDEYAEFREFE